MRALLNGNFREISSAFVGLAMVVDVAMTAGRAVLARSVVSTLCRQSFSSSEKARRLCGRKLGE